MTMKHRKNSELEELEEQLRRAEEAEAAEEWPPEEESEFEEFEEFDEEILAEEEDWDEDPSPLYRNFANGYGQQAGFDGGRSYSAPSRSDAASGFDDETDFVDVPPQPRESMGRRAVLKSESKAAKKRKKRRHGCGCLTVLVVLVLVVVGGLFLFVRPPKSDGTLGARKGDTATILICGTDADGTRTDTMMLLYLSGSERQVNLLSLPRDTYTITASGKAAKLNSAYGRNGTGEEGMDVLMDYVRDIVGYRPDGYILVDFTLVPQIVDIMGGVDVEVPMDMDVEGVYLTAGYQHLTGKQTLALLRYREGYATADLGRIQVQRTVMKAAMEQWLSPSHLSGALKAVSLLESGSLSSLSTGNYLWVAKALVLGMKNFRNDTLPGYADYRSGVSYYILNKSEVAELVNGYYNPSKTAISADDLNIAG